MTLSVFVTGTDTGCGKTRVSCALLAALTNAGFSASGMKPVATGATRIGAQWVHEDVKALVAASNVAIPRRYVNPYLFAPACSPNIAAEQTGSHIELASILQAYRDCQSRADAIVVEGVGGWCVPFSDDLWTEDLVRAINVPIILVVGVRLGCINHAVLSARAVAQAGLPLLGWVANIVDPGTHALDAVLATLTRHLAVPCITRIDWTPAATAADLAPKFRILVDRMTRRFRS